MQTPCNRCGGTIGATGHGLCASCLLRLATLPEALAPDYEIETLLGSGPAGTAYLAREVGSGNMLVVKIIAKPDGIRDAEAAAFAVGTELIGFRRPGIAVTHSVDLDPDGNLRIVRDYVPGRALSAWIARGNLSERQQVFDRLAAALAEAHAHGLAHGHLEAPNVIITAGSQPVIVDFGARAAQRALQALETMTDRMREEDRSALEALRAVLMGTA